MTFVLVVWALEQVVGSGFNREALAVWAGGGFGASDAEEMVI